MSAGAILQLVARGEEDVLLSSKPEYNLFKSVYKKFTPFASDFVNLPFNEGSSEFTNRRLSCVIPKRADLLNHSYLYVELPVLTIPSGSTYVHWTNSLGYAMIKEIYIEIGGQKIDKQYGEWMYVWNQLTTKIGIYENDVSIGKHVTVSSLRNNALHNVHLQIPLYFWFCNSAELALPLVALQYHEVKLTVELRDFYECVCYDGPTPPDRVDFKEIYLLSHFIYLEEETRKQFAQNNHVYLIEQLQRSNYETVPQGTDKIMFDLTLNHPVKELFWMFREKESEENNDWVNYASRVPLFTEIYPIPYKFSLVFDGKERFPEQHENYFREIIKSQFHTKRNLSFSYCYPFSKNPENHIQPSGSCNFSKISYAQLKCQMNTINLSPVPESTFMLFGVNYNYLIIKNGQANVYYKM